VQGSPHKVHILLVDDEPELREIFALWLQRSGYDVTTAAHGAEGLTQIDELRQAGRPPDIIVADQHMPEMSGAVMLRALHERKLRTPALLFVSGFDDLPLREAYALGVCATLMKPLRRNEMVQAIERSLQSPVERWAELQNGSSANETKINVTYPSLADACAAGDLKLGSGGLTMVLTPVPPLGNVSLHIYLNQEQRRVEARGCVRWVAAAEQLSGIELLWVAPESRDWLAEQVSQLDDPPYLPAV
jgi:CheY-like chemotaxis protein